MLRAAILRGLRPTFLILGKQPHSKWTRLDRLMLRAYQQYEDEISKSSGLPFWVSRSLDPEVIIEIEERADRADQLLAEWDHKNGGKDNKRGVSRYAVVRNASGEYMDYGGLTRQQFQQAAIQEQRDRAEIDNDPDDEGIEIERDRPRGGYDPSDYGDGVTDPD